MDTLLYTSQFGHTLAPAKRGDVGMDLPCVINEQVFVRTEQSIPRLSMRYGETEITDFDTMVRNNWINEECNQLTLFPGFIATIPSGINTKIPDGSWMMITARSSAVFRKSLLVFPGVIDEGYVGELLTRVYNPSKAPQHIKDGSSVAQAIIIPKYTSLDTKLVDRLPSTERGMAGFGSSGD
jgi:dUTP pyrophosphatase